MMNAGMLQLKALCDLLGSKFGTSSSSIAISTSVRNDTRPYTTARPSDYLAISANSSPLRLG